MSQLAKTQMCITYTHGLESQPMWDSNTLEKQGLFNII